MQLKYHDEAVSKGIHIVGTCGFDSIPADMGVSFTQENFPGLVHLIILYNFHSTFPVNFITT